MRLFEFNYIGINWKNSPLVELYSPIYLLVRYLTVTAEMKFEKNYLVYFFEND